MNARNGSIDWLTALLILILGIILGMYAEQVVVLGVSLVLVASMFILFAAPIILVGSLKRFGDFLRDFIFYPKDYGNLELTLLSGLFNVGLIVVMVAVLFDKPQQYREYDSLLGLTVFWWRAFYMRYITSADAHFLASVFLACFACAYITSFMVIRKNTSNAFKFHQALKLTTSYALPWSVAALITLIAGLIMLII